MFIKNSDGKILTIVKAHEQDLTEDDLVATYEEVKKTVLQKELQSDNQKSK